MTRQSRELAAIGFVLAMALVILLCVAAAWAATDRHVCLTKAQRAGLPADWGLMTGCRVQLPSGTWAPASRAVRT